MGDEVTGASCCSLFTRFCMRSDETDRMIGGALKGLGVVHNTPTQIDIYIALLNTSFMYLCVFFATGTGQGCTKSGCHVAMVNKIL